VLEKKEPGESQALFLCHSEVFKRGSVNQSEALKLDRFDAVDGQAKSSVTCGLFRVAQQRDVLDSNVAQDLGSDAAVFRVELWKSA